MNIDFRDLQFEINAGKVRMRRFGCVDCGPGGVFTEIQIAGENKPSHMGMKAACSSEGGRLNYAGHSMDECTLTIMQESALVRVDTVFEYRTDAKVFRAYRFQRSDRHS
jgi:hypothetical protein